MAKGRKQNIMLILIFLNGVLLPVSNQAPILEEIKTPGSSDLLEGDIVLDKNVASLIIDSLAHEPGSYSGEKTKRGAIRDPVHHWKEGVVPYVIDDSVDSRLRDVIGEAFRVFHQLTCVHFVQKTTEKDFVHIIYKDGCNSPIGRQGGEQLLSLGPGCQYKGLILHELMHTLGFFHEQSRFDRDLYVTVLWWNIVHGAEKNFATYSHGDLDTMNMPYDMQSIMHYGNTAFSKNGQHTIESTDKPNMKLGNEDGFSKLDVKKINTLYKCRPF